jgi:hypothetical protein
MAADETALVWGWSRYRDGERYQGAYDRREEAIAEGRAHEGDSVGFWIHKGRRPAPESYVPDPEWVIEHMAEGAGDEGGEAADEFPDVSAEAKAELDALLTAWARKHVKVSFWIGVGDPEYVEPKTSTEVA